MRIGLALEVTIVYYLSIICIYLLGWIYFSLKGFSRPVGINVCVCVSARQLIMFQHDKSRVKRGEKERGTAHFQLELIACNVSTHMASLFYMGR